MPFDSSWVPPEVFLRHKGVTVCCTYKNDDINNGARTYWYTLSSDEDLEQFDVRELSTWQVQQKALGKKVPRFGSLAEKKVIKMALRQAIDQKLLTILEREEDHGTRV